MAIPSERTIEFISNHAILQQLNAAGGPPYAWIHVPDQIQEGIYGHDARVEHEKKVWIQYKKLQNVATGRYKINVRQLLKLLFWRPRHAQRRYVFYAGNLTPNDYVPLPPPTDSIENDHTVSDTLTFERTFFVDAWRLIDALFTIGYGVPTNVPPVPIAPPPAAILDTDLSIYVGPADIEVNLGGGTQLHGNLTALAAFLGMPPPVAGWAAGATIVPIDYMGPAFTAAVQGCYIGLFAHQAAVRFPEGNPIVAVPGLTELTYYPDL